MRRQFAAMVVAFGVITALAGPAIAGHLTEGVKSYTGCLVSKDGVIIKINEGNSPSSPCSGGQIAVHFSGGDITKISVTGALTGGGDNGEVTIGLKPEFTLPTGCDTGEIAEWDGSAWACGIDNDTTYFAGTGLALGGTNNRTFSVAPDYRVKNTPDCSSGQFATGFASDGDIQCAAPSAGGVHAYSAHVGATILAGDTLVISKTLPAGTYLLFASVALKNTDGNQADDERSAARCTIPGFDTGTVGLLWDSGLEIAETKESVALSSAINHGGGAVELRCSEESADVDVFNATLTAIKVDSLN